MGVCKEERKLPIVQMGLFMDDCGIPIAIESFPGNTLDHLTLRPVLEKNVDGLDLSRFILIGDSVKMYFLYFGLWLLPVQCSNTVEKYMEDPTQFFNVGNIPDKTCTEILSEIDSDKKENYTILREELTGFIRK